MYTSDAKGKHMNEIDGCLLQGLRIILVLKSAILFYCIEEEKTKV